METYRKVVSPLCAVIAIGLSAFELYTVGFGILAPFAQRATMLAFGSVLLFLMKPAANWPDRDDLSPGARLAAILWDVTVIAAALISCIYLIVEEDALADRSGMETQLDLLIAGIGPMMLLEMVRRAVGVPLFLVTLAVIVYSYFGDIVLILIGALILLEIARRFAGLKAACTLATVFLLLLLFPQVRTYMNPSIYPFQGATYARMSAYLWLTSEGSLGTIAAIMSEFIFIFILFAALLEATGTGQILINLAFAITGRFRGGPAQAAVVASSMFGMVSGSTIANVVSTGTFTIPLMIRTGFSRIFAGAVEAVASCGGQIMPPIMGASVFIMAELIDVPYVFLMLHGLIPALMYYFSLSATIYFQARLIDMKTIDPLEIPSGWEQVKKGGYLLIPVVVLMASIISGETPGLAGFKAVVSLVVMVDLVRSLLWARDRWGGAGILAVGGAVTVALLLVFGPLKAPAPFTALVRVPFLEEVRWVRLALFCLGALFALLPSLRGLPMALPVALSFSRWSLPSEILWMGKIPYVGFLLPLGLVALAVVLVGMPVFATEDRVPASESAREFGRALLKGMENGAKNSLSLIAATYSIGLIVGLLVLVALGVRISILVTEVASTSLFLSFFLVMIASLVMGMGLPTIAAYLLLVIVVAPSVTKLGAPLIAAHMFIFYFGVISAITPPVALAAYAASGISVANPMRTGYAACRLAIAAFIVPFLFVYYPELLLFETNVADAVYRIFVSFLGIFFLSMAVVGFGFARMQLSTRAATAASALMLFLAQPWVNAAGFLLGGSVLLSQWLANRKTLVESVP